VAAAGSEGVRVKQHHAGEHSTPAGDRGRSSAMNHPRPPPARSQPRCAVMPARTTGGKVGRVRPFYRASAAAPRR
jgi:hypothetical protein